MGRTPEFPINESIIDKMNAAGVPPEWIVDSTDSLRKYLGPDVFQVKPQPKSLFGHQSDLERMAYVEQASERGFLNDPEAVLLVFPDGLGGWQKGWVRPIDLKRRDVDYLLVESVEWRGKNDDMSRAKMTAYIIRKRKWDLR